MRNGQVFVDAVARQENVVTVNGTPCGRGEQLFPLGSTLSLLGSVEWFNYRLVHHDESTMEDLTNEEAENKGRKRPSSPLVDLVGEEEQENAHKKGRLEKMSSEQRTTSIKNIETQLVVSLIDVDQPQRVATTVASDVSAAVQPQPATGNDEGEKKKSGVDIEGLLRQYECEICYDTLAAVCTLIPCGDCFCFPCIQGWAAKKNVCPHCQQPFDLKSTIPNKIMDNAIREIVKVDPVALRAWEQRVEEGNEARKNFSSVPVPVACKPLSHPPSSIQISVPSSSRSGPSGRRRKDAQSNGRVIDLTF
jgi:hypothetical protein